MKVDPCRAIRDPGTLATSLERDMIFEELKMISISYLLFKTLEIRKTKLFILIR